METLHAANFAYMKTRYAIEGHTWSHYAHGSLHRLYLARRLPHLATCVHVHSIFDLKRERTRRSAEECSQPVCMRIRMYVFAHGHIHVCAYIYIYDK
jgi:hypothetical protein